MMFYNTLYFVYNQQYAFVPHNKAENMSNTFLKALFTVNINIVAYFLI